MSTMISTHSKLRPYCGDREAEHFGDHRSARIAKTYASDQSGTKTYRFNALGFRGEDLDPSAKLRVFVCGASYAFGTGLDWEETWSYKFKLQLARQLGLEASQVNLLNFSQSHASADYITRTLISQSAYVKPDLVIAHYSFMHRTEYFLDGSALNVMPIPFPWYRRWRALRPGWKRRLWRWFPGLRGRKEASNRLRAWNHYSQLFSGETGFVNTLMKILLLQSFCRAHDIECLISWVEHQSLRDPRFLENAAIAPLIRLVDRKRFCPFSIVDPDIAVDVAADNIHPGARASETFAERLLGFYNQLRTTTPGS